MLAAFEDEVEWHVDDALDVRRTFRADGRDFGVARLLYEVNPRHRYGLGYIATAVKGPVYDALVHGIDAHFASADGAYALDLQLLRSDVDDTTGNGGLLDLSYRPNANNRHTLRFDYFDETVDINDLGFLLRNDYASAQYVYTYVRPEPGAFFKNRRGALALTQSYNVSDGRVVDSSIYWRSTTVLPHRLTLRNSVAYFPERFEDRDSRGNGAYRTSERWLWEAMLSTDASRIFSYTFSLGAFQEDLGAWSLRARAGVTIRPTSNVVANLDVTYVKRDGWLVYQGANNFGAYKGHDVQPQLSLSWFLTSTQQLKLSLQWAGVRAEEDGFFAVPSGGGDLVDAPRTLPNHDFSVSLLTLQLRYRWEIAPLTDLFVVYNRGNALRDESERPFSDLFDDALKNPIIDSIILKLRYRFGN